MRLRATKFMVFNAAAALVGLAALVTAVRTVLMPAGLAPCSERYHSMTAFALERDGTVLTTAELQARLGGRDLGVMDNVAIGRMPDAPAPLAMTVALHHSTTSAQGMTASKGGVAFPWEPRVLQGKASACLSYHVLFPAGFDFQREGALPGIRGMDGNDQDKFLVRLAWRSKGGGSVSINVTDKGTTRAVTAERDGFTFPSGKWVKIEQEVVLNSPTTTDGIARVWVDGWLAIDRRDVVYRTKPDVVISSVSVDAFYGSRPDEASAMAGKDAKATKISLTPFEVRW